MGRDLRESLFQEPPPEIETIPPPFLAQGFRQILTASAGRGVDF